MHLTPEPRGRRLRRAVTVAAVLCTALTLCTGCGSDAAPVPPEPLPASAPPPEPPAVAPMADGLPGMPAVTDPHNVYAAAGAGMLSEAVRSAKPLVYVPHTKSGEVRVIDPATFATVATHRLGGELQHVVPSWDMTRLYATDDTGNKIVPFDPATGAPGAPIPVTDPYNMYFSPDGSTAISVAERLRRLVFYDPHTWALQGELRTPDCAGIDHADFTPDGRTAMFTCEFAGRVAVVDIVNRTLLRMIDMPHRNTNMGPQDIKLAPDGSVFYIADSDQNGLWVLDGAATTVLREIPTGGGAHGIYLSRDATKLYVTNRHEGTVSVLDAYTGAPITKWQIPGGGSPDMGNVTADGSQLWLSGRYDRSVYVLSTTDGHLIQKIPVGNGPHGLCVWPQPGRYSLGHTGITR
ncbi:YncE family protein [Pseudonocardia cypriaca]|uniref:YVTN family beta-propeller protein n=1 Tax=Pseudonocardia cypriaca TaxID=882449 RepID=A0A543FYD5_9PSEU|nr:YncE family protein [Pseudonocardia cypriaca]TQM38832.1 YVTN family beta-propeller protein [Pseudonocardia cypriaca]